MSKQILESEQNTEPNIDEANPFQPSIDGNATVIQPELSVAELNVLRSGGITFPINGAPQIHKSFRLVGKDSFLQLKSLWQKLGERAGGPIEQFDWAEASAEFTTASQIENIGVMSGAELVAIAPLAIKRIAGVNRRLMLGVDERFEPMDFLYRNPEALASLARTLAEDPRPMYLGRLPSESGSAAAIKSAFDGRAVVIERPHASFPYITLDPSWSEPEKHLNSGRRSDLRRMQRRLEALGTAKTELLTPTPDQVDDLLNEAFEVEARSWKGIAGTALLFDKTAARQLRYYIHSAAQAGKLVIGFLRVNDQPIAMKIGIVQAESIWLLKIGYDAAFAHCSPGQLLMRDMIAFAAKKGLKSFEFLGESEPWIEVWTANKRNCVSMRIYPRSVQGALALTADTVVHSAKTIKQRCATFFKSARSATLKRLMPLLEFAARSYVAGETLDDAICVTSDLRKRRINTTIGFWNSGEQTPEQVAEQYTAGIEQIATFDNSDYVSIKLPALQFNRDLIKKIAGAAETAERRLHIDSHDIEFVTRKITTSEELLKQFPRLDIGFTLPGRWKRSLADADWAIEKKLFVRVVKGQWADPSDPQADSEQGFLNLIDRLAGRARKVAVATHDPRLARKALLQLKAAGTPCELELLHGLPMQGCLDVARDLDVPVRVYVPYGKAFLPYAISKLRRNPKILWWLLRDSFSAIGQR